MSMTPPMPGNPIQQATNSSQQDQKLLELWASTGDQSIFDFVTSGRKAPVNAAVAEQVKAIIGFDPPVVAGPAAPTSAQAQAAPVNSQPLPQMPDAGGGPMVASGNPLAGTSLPSNWQYQGQSGSGTTQFTNQRQAQGATVPGGNGGSPEFGGNDPGMAPATPTPPSAPKAGAPTATPGGSTPVSANKTIDPNSAAMNAPYIAAANGDKGNLDVIMAKVLGDLGIDVTKPGMYTGDLLEAVQPYLQTFLSFYGLHDGQPAKDRMVGAATEFGNIVGGPGTFGKLQDFGQKVLGGGAQELLNDPSRTKEAQYGLLNNLLGMTQAGNNSLLQSSRQNQLGRADLNARLAGLNDPTQQYVDWLRKNSSQPGYSQLAALLGGQ